MIVSWWVIGDDRETVYATQAAVVSHSAKDAQCRPNCWITAEILATEALLLANFCLLWQEQPSSGGWWSVTPGLSSLQMGASPVRLGHFLTTWGHFPSQPFLTLSKIHLFPQFQLSRWPLSVTLHALDSYLLPKRRPGTLETSPPGSDSSRWTVQYVHLKSHFRWKRFLCGRTQNPAGIRPWSTGVVQSCRRQSFHSFCFFVFFIPERLSQSTLFKQSPLTISLATHSLIRFLDSLVFLRHRSTPACRLLYGSMGQSIKTLY